MASSILQEIVAALLGAGAGVGIIGIADHFTLNRSVWPCPVCPYCGTRRAGVAWIPVVGLLATRSGCGSCGKQSSFFLAIAVQIISALLTVLLIRQYDLTAPFVCASLEAYLLTAVAVTDLQHRLIPTLLVYPAIAFALLSSPVWPNMGIFVSLEGGLVGFGLFFALALFARLVFGEGALGDGDVTLAALIGAICGFPQIIISLAFGALCGGVGAMLVVAVRRSAFGSTIPYGPYLVIGALYILLTGNTTHSVYAIF